MRNILLGIVIFASLPVFASSNQFQNINESFNRALRPELGPLLGKAWSGRCYLKTTPTKAMNGAIYLREAQGLEGFFLSKNGKAPDYFDRMGFSEFRGELSSTLKTKVIMNQKDLMISKTKTMSFYLRKSMNNLVLQGRDHRDNEAWVYCIFNSEIR